MDRTKLNIPSEIIRHLSCLALNPTTVIAIIGDLELDPDVTANLAALRREFDQTVSNLRYYEVS